MTDPIISKAAFARLQGVVKSRVSQWAAAGMPVTAEGKVDVQAARDWLNDNLDHTRRNRWQGTATKPEIIPNLPEGPTLANHRRDREETKAERERLALEREKGELVPRAAVQRFLEARGRMDRDAHLAWVNRISAVLAGELGINPTRLHARLEAEMRHHLATLAETPIPEEEAAGVDRMAG